LHPVEGVPIGLCKRQHSSPHDFSFFSNGGSNLFLAWPNCLGGDSVFLVTASSLDSFPGVGCLLPFTLAEPAVDEKGFVSAYTRLADPSLFSSGRGLFHPTKHPGPPMFANVLDQGVFVSAPKRLESF